MAGFFKPEDVPELMLEIISSKKMPEKVLLIESVHHGRKYRLYSKCILNLSHIGKCVEPIKSYE